MSIVRTRLSPAQSRAAALEAARAVLTEEGPQAVTLKAVAARMGRTHANLLHHFGSAGELRTELARSMAEQVTASIGEAVMRAREGKADPIEIVDQTFDAFGQGGAGALAAWMILSGEHDALEPILEAIRALVGRLADGVEERVVAELTLTLVLSALGDSLLGAPMAASLGVPRGRARELARQRIAHAIEVHRAAMSADAA